MSKKFKAQASSARAAPGFGGFGGFGSFQTSASPLSYIAEQPDLTNVADANIVVSLKNLSKKDSTTKAKALDELLESLASNDDLAILSAWSDLYPRTSIDNAQIVRRNAHILQGLLTVNAGKKIIPFLPKLVPSWLAGTFDSDKSVAKAATDALDKAFPTSEKKQALWKLYRDAINDRVEDALLVQTATSLSDERTTSPDEAESKYVRVVGTALRLLGRILEDGAPSPSVLQEKRIWDLVHHQDSYIRTSICNLLLVVLAGDKIALDYTILSTCFLYKGLNQTQIGSMRAYTQALLSLTEKHPTVWTADYSAKVSASKRLMHFLKQGSQNGPSDVWVSLQQIIHKVPSECWKKEDQDVGVLADSFRSGVVRERIHTEAAWQSYISITSFLLALLPDISARREFSQQYVLPIVKVYVAKAVDEKWKLGIKPERIAIPAMQLIASQGTDALDETWTAVVDDLIEKMRLSLPESSKDYRISQDHVAQQAKRLLALQTPSQNFDTVRPHMLTLLHAALDLLRSRNGKPYGAASIVSELAGIGFQSDEALQSFVQDDLDRLLDSPSSEQLVSLALQVGRPIGHSLIESRSSAPAHVKATEYFLHHATLKHVEELKISILAKVGHFETSEGRTFALAVLANPALLGSSIQSDILERLIADLGTPQHQLDVLATLESVMTSPTLTRSISNSAFSPNLTSKLLLLADAPNEQVAEAANSLSSSFSMGGDTTIHTLPIIRQQLSGSGDLISILSLTDLGLRCMKETDIEQLLPEPQEWFQALQPHLTWQTQTSLAITSPLKGAVWSIDPTTSSSKVIRDAEDFSLLFRITFFLTKILVSQTMTLNSGSRSSTLQHYYPLALQLVNEKLTLDHANDIWLGSTDEVVAAAADILSEGSQVIANWLSDDEFCQYWLLQGHEIEGSSRESYLKALAFTDIISKLTDDQPKLAMQHFGEDLQVAHKSDHVFRTSALLSATSTVLLTSQAGLKIVNELVSTLTTESSNFAASVYLNILLLADATVLEKVSQQRLVYLFKRVVSFLRDEADGAGVLSQSFLLASHLCPYLSDIYGDHWETLVDALVDVWEFLARDDVALLYTSLQAYSALKKMSKDESTNDDLVEVLSTKKPQLQAGLIHCLRSVDIPGKELDQPRSITSSLLRRELSDAFPADGDGLFSLLNANLPAVRLCAYDLLHKIIPKEQEKRSLDLALEQKQSHFPSELLQLLGDDDHVQRYLLSWKLVFDHYANASHKLQEGYTAEIKASGQISKLLPLLCEKFRITSGHPIDVSKYEVTEYEVDRHESPEHDIQWLATHLYYLTLKLVPSLVKDWFLEQRNNIKMPLEGWTQKYITPLIVGSSLATVTDWAATQSSEADDRPIDVKSSLRGTEFVASIQVDPESPPISLAISLPSAYPLEGPLVTGRTRVGVTDKNWQSWLRTIQIIIRSTGSIIEGLVAFRRNVQGALKGQTECAICYSIIGTDMQTPSKKCGTCKNMFHGSCLFRWFKSSNSSSCPLCRNNFNYA